MNLELMICALVCAFLGGVFAGSSVLVRWIEAKDEDLQDLQDQILVLREQIWKVEERL